MAPFGKHLLKARLKNKSRAESKDPSTEKEIQVCVCQEEKIVCGITKHTTCAEVVEALLEEHNSCPESQRVLLGEAQEYCLLEKWKGFERVLPPLTRILRLWESWGHEKPWVEFVLVDTAQFSQRASTKGPAHYIKSLPPERQRRTVKKAFRKLERIRRQRRPQDAAKVDHMVQLILAQDHSIQQQLHHMAQLDLEIEQLEQDLRIQPHSHITQWESTGEAQLEEYLCRTEGIEQLDLQVKNQEELIQKLTLEIDTEFRNLQEPLGASGGPDPDPGDTAELTRTRQDLEYGLRCSLTLHAQTAELQQELRRSEALLRSRSWEYERLLEDLADLQVEDKEEEEEEEPAATGVNISLTTPSTELTDTDSDTGISSTHSQDSLAPCVESCAPLDTDV